MWDMSEPWGWGGKGGRAEARLYLSLHPLHEGCGIQFPPAQIFPATSPGSFIFVRPPATPNQSPIPDHIKLARIETLSENAAHF